MLELEDVATAIKEEMKQPDLSRVRFAELRERLLLLQEEPQ